MKSHFMKEKEVVLTYRWQFQDERSKEMGTERDKEVLWKVDPKGRVLFSWDVKLPLIMDFKFLYPWSDLFYVYLWNLLLTLAKWITVVSLWLIWSHDIYWKHFLNHLTLANFEMLQRAPETSQREILNYLGSLDMLKYMGSTVEGVINLNSLYCMYDVTNIDILDIMWNS